MARLEPHKPDGDSQGSAFSGQARPMGVEFPVGTDPVSIRKRIEAMEILLERSFKVPGVNVPVGLDALIGLVPILGEIVTTAMGAYIVWEARNLDLPRWKIWRMIGNVGFDAALGAVPVIGDAADFLFRSNTRNLRIVKKHLDKHYPSSRTIDG